MVSHLVAVAVAVDVVAVVAAAAAAVAAVAAAACDVDTFGGFAQLPGTFGDFQSTFEGL